MAALFLSWACALGLGQIVPRRSVHQGDFEGARFFGGIALIALSLFLLNTVFRLPISLASFAIVAVAGVGVVLFGRRIWAGRDQGVELLTHPIVVLPAVVVAAVAVRGGIDYLPWGWDEFSNWLGFAKQMVIADDFRADTMIASRADYPFGWRYLMAFPGAVLGGFTEERAYPFAFLLHAGFLGFLYDVLRWRLARIEALGNVRASGLAWLAMLAFVTVEITWLLVPTNLLVERPQVYTLAACLLLGFGLVRDESDRMRWAAGLGIVLAFGYLVRVQMVLLTPSVLLLLIAAAWSDAAADGPGGWRRRAVAAARLAVPVFLPFAAVFVTWTLIRPYETCAANLTSYFDPQLAGGLAGAPMADLAASYTAAIWGYVSHYKWPVTVGSLAAMVGALASRGRRDLQIFVGAVAVFAAIYTVMLFWAYVACPGSFNRFLSSFERYYLVLVRVVHFAGFLLAAEIAIDWVRRFEGFDPRIRSKPAAVALVVAVGLLGIWQVAKVNASLREMEVREELAADHVATLRRIGNEARALSRMIAGKGLERPDVVILTTYPTQLPRTVAVYFGAGAVANLPVVPFEPSIVTAPAGSSDAVRGAVRDAVAKARIVWPLDDHVVFAEELGPLVPAAGCAPLSAYFLVRDAGAFACVPKTTAAP